MGTKRDYMYMLLLLLVVVLGSCVMEDSRLITPKEESKFEEVVHKATLKSKNVQFLCKPDLIQAEIEEAPEVVEEVEDLSSKTLTELKAMAKTSGIKGYSTMKKDELIASLSE